MKKIIVILFVGILSLNSLDSIGQSESSKNTAQNFYLYIGYGSHGIDAGCNWRIATALSEKTATRIYIDWNSQSYTFDKPLTFNGQEYNSDSRINSFGAGISQEFYLGKAFHMAPFLGVRMEDTKFKDAYINTTIGEGQLIRYWNGVEVGSRLNKDYGIANLTFDIGLGLNIRLAKRIWINGKIAFAPIKYKDNDTMYGKYWADTPHQNDFAINRSPLRVESTLSIGF